MSDQTSTVSEKADARIMYEPGTGATRPYWRWGVHTPNGTLLSSGRVYGDANSHARDMAACDRATAAAHHASGAKETTYDYDPAAIKRLRVIDPDPCEEHEPDLIDRKAAIRAVDAAIMAERCVDTSSASAIVNRARDTLRAIESVPSATPKRPASGTDLAGVVAKAVKRMGMSTSSAATQTPRVLDLAGGTHDNMTYTLAHGLCTNCGVDYAEVRIAKGERRPGYANEHTTATAPLAKCTECGVHAVIVEVE